VVVKGQYDSLSSTGPTQSMAKSTYRLHFRLRAVSQIAGRHLAFEVAVKCAKEQRRGEDGSAMQFR
jgi:hypothetical protein